jgi:hypothetical protein
LTVPAKVVSAQLISPPSLFGDAAGVVDQHVARVFGCDLSAAELAETARAGIGIAETFAQLGATQRCWI